jgi:tetratricopeptide (TPR) repeat protein
MCQEHEKFYVEVNRRKAKVEELRTMLSRDPNSLAILGSLGAALEWCGKPAEAAEVYREMLSLDPESDEIKQFLAGALYSGASRSGTLRQQLPEITHLYESIRTYSENHAGTIQFVIGKAFLEAGLPSEAEPYLRRACQGSTENSAFELIHAYALIACGKVDEGLNKLYKNTGKKNAGVLELRELVIALEKIGRFEEAKQYRDRLGAQVQEVEDPFEFLPQEVKGRTYDLILEESKVIQNLFIERISIQETADNMGTTEECVNHLLENALKVLQLTEEEMLDLVLAR